VVVVRQSQIFEVRDPSESLVGEPLVQRQPLVGPGPNSHKTPTAYRGLSAHANPDLTTSAMPCQCHAKTIDPQGTPRDNAVLRVLAFMKREGFPTVLPFLEAFWDSKNQRLQSRVGYFYSHGGFQSLLGRVIQHSRFAAERRNTQRDTDTLTETQIGMDIINMLLRIIRQEFQSLHGNQESRSMQMRARDMTAEVASQFSFKERETFYLDNAPILSFLIRELCDVNSSEAEPADDDGDDTEDSEPDSMEFRGPKVKSKRFRAKWVIATTVLSLITFAQSRQNCYFQVSTSILQQTTVQLELMSKTALGYFMQASRVPKRVVAVMNQLGVSVSYDSVIAAVKANGQMELERVRGMVRHGVPFGICWDNLVLDSHKKE